MQNKAFNEIIRREIDMMFGVEKPKKAALPEIPAEVEPRDSLSQSSQSLSESNAVWLPAHCVQLPIAIPILLAFVISGAQDYRAG